MKFLKSFLFIGILSFGMASCSKDESKPEITITSPQDGAVVAPGSTLAIVVSLSDDLGVTSLTYVNSTLGLDGSEAIAPSPTSTFTLTLTLDANTPTGDYDIEFEAKDADGNSDKEKLKIKVQ